MPDLRIRALATPDRSAVESVLRAAGPFRAEEIATALWVFDQAQQPGEDYRLLGAFLGADLAGYVCFGPTPMTEGCWHLYWVAVDQRFQRAGVARALLAAVQRECSAARARLLSLEASGAAHSDAARAFYQAVGFREEGRVRDYYRPGDDLVLFVCRL